MTLAAFCSKAFILVLWVYWADSDLLGAVFFIIKTIQGVTITGIYLRTNNIRQILANSQIICQVIQLKINYCLLHIRQKLQTYHERMKVESIIIKFILRGQHNPKNPKYTTGMEK
jgi:hypothetical protein